MALPRYDNKNKTIPVLDHRSAASSWAPPASEADFVEEAIELSPAERARTMVANARTGVLGSVVGDGAPFGFPVNFSVTEDGVPLLAVPSSVEKAAQLRASMTVSFAVSDTPLTSAAGSGGAGGTTILGNLRLLDREERNSLLREHGKRHTGDVAGVQRGRSKLWMLKPLAVVVNAGNELVRLGAKEYAYAKVDPLAAVAPGLASHLSSGQNGSLVLLARAFGGVPSANSAELSGIDRLGMDLLVNTGHGREQVRLAFSQPVSSPDEVRRELSTMVRGARFKLGGG